jgi:hypothetical protein
VSPAYGSIVAPGEVVRIEVEVAPGHAYTSLAIVSPLGFSDIAKSSPYILTLTIPLDTSLRENHSMFSEAGKGKTAKRSPKWQ